MQYGKSYKVVTLLSTIQFSPCRLCLKYFCLPYNPHREDDKIWAKWADSEGNWNLPNGWAQKLVISGMKSSWNPVIIDVPQGSILDPTLCNTFINDLNDGADYTLSIFADDTKMGGVLDTIEGHAAVQEGPWQAEEMSQWEPHEVQQKELQSPALGKSPTHLRGRVHSYMNYCMIIGL